MSVCVPIRDMKDTTRFVEVVSGAGAPVTVTRNGYDALVVMTPEAYDGLRLEAARARLYTVLDEAEREIENGDVVDYDGFIGSLRSRRAC